MIVSQIHRVQCEYCDMVEESTDVDTAIAEMEVHEIFSHSEWRDLTPGEKVRRVRDLKLAVERSRTRFAHLPKSNVTDSEQFSAGLEALDRALRLLEEITKLPERGQPVKAEE